MNVNARLLSTFIAIPFIAAAALAADNRAESDVAHNAGRTYLGEGRADLAVAQLPYRRLHLLLRDPPAVARGTQDGALVGKIGGAVFAPLLRMGDEDIAEYASSWEDHIVLRAMQNLRSRHLCLARPRDLAEQARLIAHIKNAEEVHYEPSRRVSSKDRR